MNRPHCFIHILKKKLLEVKVKRLKTKKIWCNKYVFHTD